MILVCSWASIFCVCYGMAATTNIISLILLRNEGSSNDPPKAVTRQVNYCLRCSNNRQKMHKWQSAKLRRRTKQTNWAQQSSTRAEVQWTQRTSKCLRRLNCDVNSRVSYAYWTGGKRRRSDLSRVLSSDSSCQDKKETFCHLPSLEHL